VVVVVVEHLKLFLRNNMCIGLLQVCPERNDLIHKNYRKLCNLLVDVDEWGQVIIINMLTRYARTQFTNPNADVSQQCICFCDILLLLFLKQCFGNPGPATAVYLYVSAHESSNEMSASSVGGIFLQWYGMSVVCICRKWTPGLQVNCECDE